VFLLGQKIRKRHGRCIIGKKLKIKGKEVVKLVGYGWSLNKDQLV